jgi:EAL domain-containing protein (putative c-di-GMP-specific phosphodiesterase class I)
MRMFAAGVETEEAYAEMKRLGCDHAQGFHLSRLVPATTLDHWLRNRRALDDSPNHRSRVSHA